MSTYLRKDRIVGHGKEKSFPCFSPPARRAHPVWRGRTYSENPCPYIFLFVSVTRKTRTYANRTIFDDRRNKLPYRLSIVFILHIKILSSCRCYSSPMSIVMYLIRRLRCIKTSENELEHITICRNNHLEFVSRSYLYRWKEVSIF